MDGAQSAETIALDLVEIAPQEESISGISSAAAREAVEAGEPAPVALADLAVASAGMAALAAAIALGSGDLLRTVESIPALLGPIAGAMLLTSPGLVVAHQFLGASSSLGSVVLGVARGFCRAGWLAWGLVPFAAYFSSTAPGWWSLILPVLGAVIGGSALAAAGLSLSDGAQQTVAERIRWNSVVIGWVLMTAAISARLAALGW